MMTIRLARTGTVKRPFYQLVVTEKRNPRNGRVVERLGFFNPIARGEDPKAQIDMPRVSYWLSKGSACSQSAKKIIKHYGKKEEHAAIPAVA